MSSIRPPGLHTQCFRVRIVFPWVGGVIRSTKDMLDTTNTALPSVELILCHQVVPDVYTHSHENEEMHDVHELIFVLSGSYRAILPGIITGKVPVSRRHTADPQQDSRTQPSQRRQQNTGHLAPDSDGWYTCQPGMGMLYPAGVRHRRSVDRDGATNLITIQWRGPWPSSGDSLPMSDLQAGPFDDPTGAIRSGLMWLLGLPHTDSQRRVQRHALLIAVLEQIRCAYLARDDYLDPIAEIHRFLVETISYPITMAMLADRSGLGVSTINYKFRRKYGMAPMTYLQRLRAEHAARLISTSTISLPEVADQVGLKSTSYLTRILKKHLGADARSLRQGEQGAR